MLAGHGHLFNDSAMLRNLPISFSGGLLISLLHRARIFTGDFGHLLSRRNRSRLIRFLRFIVRASAACGLVLEFGADGLGTGFNRTYLQMAAQL